MVLQPCCTTTVVLQVSRSGLMHDRHSRMTPAEITSLARLDNAQVGRAGGDGVRLAVERLCGRAWPNVSPTRSCNCGRRARTLRAVALPPAACGAWSGSGGGLGVRVKATREGWGLRSITGRIASSVRVTGPDRSLSAQAAARRRCVRRPTCAAGTGQSADVEHRLAG